MEFDPAKGNLMARAIVEILGKPKEHVEETLKLVIRDIRSRKKLELVKEQHEKAAAVEGLWSAFTELEIIFASFEELITFCFDFMPSSVEIIEPEGISLQANQMSGMLNDLLGGLHNLDMKVKNFRAERDVLQTNAEALLKNLVLVSLHQKEYKLKDLSDAVGVKELQLAPFLTRFMDQGVISQKKDGKYVVGKGKGK